MDVHLVEDLLQLPSKHKNVFHSLLDGYFTVKKTNRAFSNIGTDQAHEQNNKLVKIDGGAIGILENQNALLKWAVAGPIISDMLKENEGEHMVDLATFHSHHEYTEAFEKAFRVDAETLLNAYIECGNPFQEREDGLVHLLSKHVLGDGNLIIWCAGKLSGETGSVGRQNNYNFI